LDDEGALELVPGKIAGHLSLPNITPFRKGLAELGYVEGRNIQVQYRWAEGRYDRQPALIAELIRHPVAVLAVFNIAAALAAKQADTTLPILFAASGDPVKLGLVATFNRPGGNLSGVSFLNTLLVAKQFEVLHELVRSPALLGVLVNPSYVNAEDVEAEARRAAVVFGRELVLVRAASESEIEAAFAMLTRMGIGGLLVGSDPFFDSRADRMVELATHHALPAIYPLREYATAGGLMSYGTSITQAFRLVGSYAGRILKGETPANLPIQQSTNVELVVNLRTAKALGLDVPPSLVARADEVIE
jgi:putative tryptophan/tyrosine transport system substrate-binding protein